MVRVKSCCCGCSLRTGTLIILWLFVVLNALFIALMFYGIIRVSIAHHELVIENRLAVLIGLTGLQLAVAGIALCGTFCQRKPSYLLPFICLRVFEIGALVVMLWSYWSTLWLWTMFNHYYMLAETHVQALCSLFSIAFSSYLTVVVYSYYKQMVDEIKGINRADYQAPLARVA